VVMMMMIAVC